MIPNVRKNLLAFLWWGNQDQTLLHPATGGVSYFNPLEPLRPDSEIGELKIQTTRFPQPTGTYWSSFI